MYRPVIKISLICLALALPGLMVVAVKPVEAKPAIESTIPAPPEPIYEVDQGERPGYTWSPGYWRWSSGRHVWASGRWVVDRPGYHWMSDGWEQRGESWRFVKGHWEKDEADLVEEDVTEPTVEPTSAPSARKLTPPAKTKPLKHALKRPNYRNTRLYPPVTQH